MAVTAIIGLAGAGYSIYQGEQKKKEAKAMAAKAGDRPKFETPRGEFDNLALLQSRASQGLSDSTLEALNSGNERAYSSSVRDILLGGGNANNIAGLYDKYNTSLSKIALADDAQKVQNINNMITQQSRMSAFAEKEYQVNELDPWKDQMQAANALSVAGNDQVTSGVGTGIQTIGSVAQSGMMMHEINKVNKETKEAGKQGGGGGLGGDTFRITSSGDPIGPQEDDPYATSGYNKNNIDWSQVSPETRTLVSQLFGL